MGVKSDVQRKAQLQSAVRDKQEELQQLQEQEQLNTRAVEPLKNQVQQLQEEKQRLVHDTEQAQFR